MSDHEVDEVATVMAGGPMDVDSALQEVLKTALIHDGLARGIRVAVKALDKRQALLCILANSCDEPAYTKLVTALCSEHGIPLLTVDSNKMLGEWSGLCKIDKEGKARKVVGSSCVVITGSVIKMSGHTIMLIQSGNRLDTRSYSDFDSLTECLEGICRLYEEHLKRSSPTTPSITYDISQLFDFIDDLPDLSVLAYNSEHNMYAPYGKDWVKEKIYVMLRRQAATK
ncbi:unnamed protein product [Notodromas monacha]|uniref:40S ribosomal protein S12 n=1 Tax=Notodromas monacha TaxID=399045 RepID=A0A7R9BF91_9CRUS|nr:unnamed protein product [Notodromas monacha]CAG0913116.1 unnamed protein product [Notodromas monacha]